MKFEIHIDATPAEARQLFGLPDLTPVHDAWVERLTKLAAEGPDAKDWQKLAETWMSAAPAAGLEVWQGLLKTAMSAGRKADPKDK